MFHKEFYPTPEPVMQKMTDGLDLNETVVWEPQAGKADLVVFLQGKGCKVLACEINPDLAIIAAQKADQFLGNDCFEVDSSMVSHIHHIIMNPPFSNAHDHILHAYEVAPQGCTITALCNHASINLDNVKFNRLGRKWMKVRGLVDSTDGEIVNLGNCFSTAERTTDVEVAMVRIHKPKTGDREFEDYLFTSEEEEELAKEGLLPYSELRALVGRFIDSVKRFDTFMSQVDEMNTLIGGLGGNFHVDFRTQKRNASTYSSITRDEFKKELQKAAWLKAFAMLDLKKYLTQSVLDELNARIESKLTLPFTLKNIRQMLSIVVGTHGNRMKKVLVTIFDRLTKHHHENRYHVEGWKTNEQWYVGKKFIDPYCGVGMGWSGQPEIRWSSAGEKMDDLTKALCALTGKKPDEYPTLYDFFRGEEVPNHHAADAIKQLSEFIGEPNLKKCETLHYYYKYWAIAEHRGKRINRVANQLKLSYDFVSKVDKWYQEKKFPEKYFGDKIKVYKQWGKWAEWGFFKIRVYKKGTLHAQFLDEKVWELFNRECAKAKGWQLPETTRTKYRAKDNTPARAQDIKPPKVEKPLHTSDDYHKPEAWVKYCNKANRDDVHFPDFKRALTCVTVQNESFTYYFDGICIEKHGWNEDINQAGIGGVFNQWKEGKNIKDLEIFPDPKPEATPDPATVKTASFQQISLSF